METVDDRIARAKAKMKIASPVNQDYVVKINPDKDIITAVDKDETELHSLCFVVDGKNVYFKTPRNCYHKQFAEKLAQLSIILCKIAPNVLMPDDLTEAIKNPLDKGIQTQLYAHIVSAQQISNLTKEIFFNYLEGHIEGIELSEYNIKYPRKLRTRKSDPSHIAIDKQNKRELYYLKCNADLQRSWFDIHARTDSLIKIFYACLAVDEWYKKKSGLIIDKMSPLQNSKVLPFVNTSASKPDSTPENGKNTPPSSYIL